VDTINFKGTDGLKQGKWIENNYSKNPSEGIYKNSIKEGVWTEYYNQQRTKVKSRITFVNGYMEGAAVLFDSITSDSSIGTYSENKFIPNSKK
jgi:antitoxin component YwqK of YwqJK toxin-antitoxin module